MSVKIMSLVWEHYPAGGGELLTALAYADHAHDDGTGIRPSVAYVARKTRQSERTVQRYLASMRKKKWLLIVRNADGGRGYTTEYRVNPLWITNPDILTPFPNRKHKRVSNNAKKGDNDCAKRVTQVTPQPSLTIREPTTTAANANKTPVVDLDALNWPNLFTGEIRASAIRILSNCPLKDKQRVLYEIAGMADKGSVRHPLGLLKNLVDRAANGLFVPAAAIEWERNLKSRASNEIQTTSRKQLCKQSPLSHDLEPGRLALIICRQHAGIPPKQTTEQ